MKPQDLTVRCMVWPEGGQWVAVCLDFTLAAQGGSRDEARKRLHAQIDAYVREAFTVDVKHADALLSRRAPLVDRLGWHFWLLLSRRPRIRRGLGRLARRLAPGIRPQTAYCDALPLMPA